jgi:NAD(P)-dependent dehydrogenase (short-subunit alcohol dehydrogenase family)
VLVTGCSGGIGLATATLLAARGWRVFGTMRDPGRDPGLAGRIGGGAGRAEILALDLTDGASVRTAVSQLLVATGGELYAVVHNAGTGDAGFFEDMPDAAFRRVLETNFLGAVALTRAALPAMRRAGAGRLVIVSSAAVFFPAPAQTAYTASKTALEGWAESLALEVAPFGIRLALVEPGAHRTGIWDAAEITGPADSPYHSWLTSLVPRMRALALRRGGDPARVAAVIAAALEARRVRLRYLVGPDARGARLLAALPGPARQSIQRAFYGRPAVTAAPPAPPGGAGS